MTELTQGIFSTAKNIYKSNKGSILRTIIYTIGHFAILQIGSSHNKSQEYVKESLQ